MNTEVTKDTVDRYLRQTTYQFAKTMPGIPHEYTLRRFCPSSQFYTSMVDFIRANGKKERWGKCNHSYYYVDGYKYWAMDGPSHETTVLNRAVVGAPGDVWDQVADEYDATFSDPGSKAEDREVIDLIDLHHGETVLDIGAGTGLLLDYERHKIAPEDYTAIEPSPKMVAHFREKHPEYADRIYQGTYEEWRRTRIRRNQTPRFDYVVSMFGPPNYINPGQWHTIPTLKAEGGRMFLMFFKPDYRPETILRTGVEIAHYATDWRAWQPASVAPFHNYLIVR